jgi:hypothetical protein
VPNDDYFVSVGLQWTNKKIGKIVTLYQGELFKKIPRLGTFCTQSVNEGSNLGKEEIWERFSFGCEIILRNWWQNTHGVTTKREVIAVPDDIKEIVRSVVSRYKRHFVCCRKFSITSYVKEWQQSYKYTSLRTGDKRKTEQKADGNILWEEKNNWIYSLWNQLLFWRPAFHIQIKANVSNRGSVSVLRHCRTGNTAGMHFRIEK